MPANASKFINTITGSITNEALRDQIPVLTQANSLGMVWAVLEQNSQLYSAFCSALANRIARVSFTDKTDWQDPIRNFIGDGTEVPLGYYEEQIGENPLTPHEFDPNDFMAILRRYGSDTKAVYYERNYKKYFAITIDYDGLKEAFVSDEEFLRFIRLKRAELRVSYELNSYNTFQQLICSNYASGAFITKTLPSLATADDIANFTADVNTLADNFGYYSDSYNNYKNIEGSGGSFYTYTKPEDIRIIAKSDIINSYMVKSLASAFNMSMAELKGKILKVPEFAFDIINGDGVKVGRQSTDIAFILCDKAIFKFVKHLDRYAEEFNAGTLTTQLFHHYWNTYGINPMANCIVYTLETSDDKYLEAQMSQPLIMYGQKATANVYGSEAATTNVCALKEIVVGNVDGDTLTDEDDIIEALGITYQSESNKTVADWFGTGAVTATGGYVINVERTNTDLRTLDSAIASLLDYTSGHITFTITSTHGETDVTFYFTVV